MREAYKLVTAHLLEVAGERGEESLSEMDKSELLLLAMEIIDDENFTDKLVEAVEDYIEDYGDGLGL